MKKIMVLFILVMVNQILLAQSSTLIFEINGRRTPAEEDYIKRAVQDLYESEKANIRNQILANLGSDIENPVVTLPDEILVIWSEGDYLTPVRLDIYFDEDIVIDADWEGCTVRATLGGVGATLAMGINHSSGQYDYRLVTNDIYIYTLEVDIDAWADYWYQFWNHLICPAAGEFVDGILSFAANIYINFFNLTSLYLNNMPLLIDPVDHFLAFNYDLIQDDEVANNYLLEAFPVELDADVEGNDLIISVDILQGTTDNPNLFTGIEPILNPSPEYELSGFSFLYHQLQGAFNWIGDEWTEDDRVNAAFDFMDKEILGYDFASYRVEAPWRKLQNEFITGAGLNHEDITEEDILWYMDPVNGYWSIEEVDNLRAILENGYSRGFIPFMAIAVGHFDHLPKVNEINAAICSDGYSPPGGCSCNCISEDEFLYNLKLHSRAIIREFADLIPTWQLENELNAAGIAYLEGWWRKGDMWIDDDFTDKIMNILIESVNIEDPSAKKLTPFHVFDLANCLVRWGENLDIIGVNAYPNHFTALPNMGFVVGDIVWSVKRALTALGWEEKPVWLTETGYPAIEENDSVDELTLEEDLYYFSESRQEQYIHDSFVAALLSGADRYYYFSLVWPEDSSATDNEDNKTIQYSGLIRKDETNPFVFEPKMALSTFSDDVIAHYPGISDVTLNISTTENADAKISIKGHVDKKDSGAQIPVIQGETYISRVEQEFIVEEKHHDWNYDLSRIYMENSFTTSTDQDLDAVYIPTLPITFITNGFDIQFKDEWFVENGDEENPLTWVQPNEFRSLSEQVDGNNQINVFLNQNLLFNDTDPIYSLRAPLLINEGSGIYQVFDHWVAMDNNGVGLSPTGIFEYDENRQTRVVFTDDVASVEAEYVQVELIVQDSPGGISFTNQGGNVYLVGPRNWFEGSGFTKMTVEHTGDVYFYGNPGHYRIDPHTDCTITVSYSAIEPGDVVRYSAAGDLPVIPAGTVIEMPASSSILLEAAGLFAGEAGEPVEIRGIDNSTWYGIESIIERLEHLEIADANTALNLLNCPYSEIQIHDLYIHDCGTALLADGANEEGGIDFDISISDCRFTDNGYGVLAYNSRNINLNKVLISNCTSAGISVRNDCIYQGPDYDIHLNRVTVAECDTGLVFSAPRDLSVTILNSIVAFNDRGYHIKVSQDCAPRFYVRAYYSVFILTRVTIQTTEQHFKRMTAFRLILFLSKHQTVTTTFSPVPPV